jgi:hypothetical protein
MLISIIVSTMEIGPLLLSMVRLHDPAVTPHKLLRLEFQCEETSEMPLVWVLSQSHCYTCGVYDWVERLLTESTASKISILRETRFMNEQELFKEIVEQSKTRTYTIRSLTSNTVIMSSCRKFFAGVAGGLSGRSSVRRPGSECGGNFWIVFLINFLAKSGNSKHFSFFSFPPLKKKKRLWSLCLPGNYEKNGHYVCLPSP